MAVFFTTCVPCSACREAAACTARVHAAQRDVRAACAAIAAAVPGHASTATDCEGFAAQHAQHVADACSVWTAHHAALLGSLGALGTMFATQTAEVKGAWADFVAAVRGVTKYCQSSPSRSG